MIIKSFHSIYCKLSLATGIIFLLSSFTFTNPLTKVDNKSYVKELSPSKKVKYHKDATRLALRLISKEESYQQLEAKVPLEMVSSIYDALVAVYFSDCEEAVQVTEVHKLHTFPSPAVDNFLVVYERSANWAKPLRLGDSTTESPFINDLCEQYQLIIDNHVEWDEDHNSFNVRAVESLNISAIATQFMEIEGITKVDIMKPNGDGNDIEISKTDNGWMINYIIKFDSCFTNCKKKHFWKFEVDNSGHVHFVEESGDELPIWMAQK